MLLSPISSTTSLHILKHQTLHQRGDRHVLIPETAYRQNTLTSVNLDNKDTYTGMLYIAFSSAFNSIIPQTPVEKLSLLSQNTSTCCWILDFLTDRPQSVRVGKRTSGSITLSPGTPQGCVLSPRLFTLLSHDCITRYKGNQIIKSLGDTTVAGLISRNDETVYREEVKHLGGIVYGP